MKIELGSGYDSTRGWVHVDVNRACAPHVCADVQALPFGDETVGQLRAVDVLEHVTYWSTADVLTEWVRVLAPGGTLFVQVPDAWQIMFRYVEINRTYGNEPTELVERPMITRVAWRLLGGHHDGVRVKDGDDWRLNAHYALFSHDSLVDELEHAGLTVTDVQTNPFPNLQAWAVKV